VITCDQSRRRRPLTSLQMRSARPRFRALAQLGGREMTPSIEINRSGNSISANATGPDVPSATTKRDAFRWYRWAKAATGRPELSATAKNLAWVLASHANGSTGKCWPSRACLAEELGGCRLATVTRAVGELEERGWVRVEHGKGRTVSHYWLIEPDREVPKTVPQRYPKSNRRGTQNRTRNYEGNCPRELRRERGCRRTSDRTQP
jgi:hypothetical protein